MVGVIVITHGRLGRELVETASAVLGELERVVAVEIDPSASEAQMIQDLEKALAEVDQGRGVLILADLIGGTPSNLGMRLMEHRQLEVLTGVNLPMLLRVGNTRGPDLQEVAAAVREAGMRGIVLASDLLRRR